MSHEKIKREKFPGNFDIFSTNISKATRTAHTSNNNNNDQTTMAFNVTSDIFLIEF